MFNLFLEATPPDFSAITDALSAQLNVTQVGTIVAAVLGASIGLFIFWWGARKIISAVTSAFRSGKIEF